MQINIEINDQLLMKAMSIFGAKTKQQAVNEALRFVIQCQSQESIRNIRGIGGWEGHLPSSRLAHGEQ